MTHEPYDNFDIIGMIWNKITVAEKVLRYCCSLYRQIVRPSTWEQEIALTAAGNETSTTTAIDTHGAAVSSGR